MSPAPSTQYLLTKSACMVMVLHRLFYAQMVVDGLSLEPSLIPYDIHYQKNCRDSPIISSIYYPPSRRTLLLMCPL